MERTFNPCDECDYSFSKQNQESGMCKICGFKKLLDLEEQGKLLKLEDKYQRVMMGQEIFVVEEDSAVTAGRNLTGAERKKHLLRKKAGNEDGSKDMAQKAG